MWEIFEIIASAFESDEIVSYLTKLYKKYFNTKTGEKIGIETWSNPFALKKLVKSLMPDEIKQLKSLNRNYQQVLKQLNKQEGNANQKQQVASENQQEKLNQDFWIPVNSSWILQGKWTETNSRTKTGNLTLLIQSDKNPKIYGPYTYPGVPYEVWDLMCQAKGSHGSGAGTIFWRYWLRRWLPSQVRKYVKKSLAKEFNIFVGNQSINIPNLDTENMIKVRNYIFKLEKGFIRTKFGQTQSGLLTKQWKNQRARVVTNQAIKAKRWEVYSMNTNIAKKIKKGGKIKWQF